ncbi:hypothetical protein [Brevibacterium metallidurans]|uniref:Nucleotidyl transferase AbiEii toxin, Type IV TA system n=1 Tax=Brevibacterium metallidurans TaxID=1482676 RepID=A0ABN0SSS7_9MICO
MNESERQPQEAGTEFAELLESAAKLQEAVPGAVVVGGTAAAFHSRHRISHDHDHVLMDLRYRYDTILDAVESLDGWATDPNVSKPPLTIMGELDGFQAGVRNLRRARPLEVEEHRLPSGRTLRVPTAEEILRVKAFLASQRKSVRDFLDVAAVSDHLGIDLAAETLAGLDSYYDPRSDRAPVRTAVERALADPRPKDTRTLDRLADYKGLRPEWTEWSAVVEQCRRVAVAMTRKGDRR